jgi:Super-infection exclusion protein B
MLEPIAPLIAAVRDAGPRIYLSVLILTGLMLFLPQSVIATLGLSAFVRTFRPYLGAGFIASIALLAWYVFNPIAQSIVGWLEDKRRKRAVMRTLRELATDEKEFLRPYLREDANTMHAFPAHGIANGLEAKGIVYRSSTISIPGGMFPYNLQSSARRLLKAHPELLD